MTDFSSYTHKWRAVTNNDHRSDANKVTKRNRQPVSCQPCRARKLKCDRGHPCDGCVKRGESSSCVYGKNVPTQSLNGSATRKDEGRISAKAQDRLKHLEDLVRSIVESPNRLQSSPEDNSVLDSILQAASDEGAVEKNTFNGSSYTGSTHWSAVLQHISELRSDLGTESPDYENTAESIDYSKPDALFGGHHPHSLEQILNNHLPPRIQVDRRINQYFNAQYMIIPFVHGPQFYRQYERFWADPLGTNVIWIAKMFSIACLAASLNLAASQAAAYKAEIAQQRDSFEAAAGECLVLGNYSKPQPHVVEALALFMQCKYMRSWDPQPEVALMFGVQTRLAFMMGYHRDGSNFPNISPFETEMRRRVWAMLRQFDQLIAFQLGIPNNVPPESWDTANPSNLTDADFDEDVEVLPPSRPETDTTQILYFVVKARLMDVYSKVCYHTNSFPATPPTGAEIMALDRLIRETADGIPEALRARPISQSVTDPAFSIMIRINISFLWRKTLCVLHRKYMVAEGNEYSYRTCFEAATSICETFIDVYPEFSTGGTFGNDRWMLTSFTIIDFLLVNMVLCLAVSISRKRFLKANGDDCTPWLASKETKKVMAILEKSHTICVDLGKQSREAKRVSAVLDDVLGQLKSQRSTPPATNNGLFFKFCQHNGRSKLEDKPIRTANGVVDRDGISLKPLSLSERPNSVNMSSGMFPPSFHSSDKQLYGSSNDSPSLQGSDTQTSPLSQQGTAYTDPLYTNPLSQNMNGASLSQANAVDVDPGFFTNFMGEIDGASMIDWTQLDQFTGFFGHDPNYSMIDFYNSQNTANDLTSGDIQNKDLENWNSTPLYSFGGGRTFDPVTGTRQQA